MIKNFIRAGMLIVSAAAAISAQTPSPKPAAPATPQAPTAVVSLETILAEAEKQVANYQETFKDLLAVETKTFEKYDKNGELKDETVIESNFFVYQSSKDEKTSTELRNVIKADRKLVPDSQARADRFLEELQKTKTVEKELEEIQDEGLRYDKTLKISGFTLFEAIALASNLRPFFDFKLLGSENYQGREVYLVSYQQTRKSPFITVNEKESKEKGIKADIDAGLPGALKKADKFLRGKLWIDRETFQIWREERQLTVQTGAPIVAQETVFEYAPSEFGILVPKKITFIDNSVKKISKSDEFAAVKNARVVFDYTKFRKTNVEVQIIDDP
jgi:hypothetical protein